MIRGSFLLFCYTKDMFKKIENFTIKNTLITPNTRLIVGLSGGPDSVFLLHFLHHIKKKYTLTLIAAHLNHGWRDTAVHDEQFCKNLAESLDIPFVSAHAQNITLTCKSSGSQEDLGRQLRRAFFLHVAQEHQAGAIALAHHQDDLIETFFIRLLRGAGVTGLASIRAKQGLYVRPLLNTTKQEILTYLHAHNIAYCTDITNEQDTYLRNRIRKYLVPAAAKCDERAPKTIVNTIEQLQAADDFIEAYIHEIYTKIAPHNILDITELKIAHPFVQKRIILHWLCVYKVKFTVSDALFNEILRFLWNEAPTHTINEWIITKKKGRAAIVPKKYSS